MPQQGQDRDVRDGGRVQLLDQISHEQIAGCNLFKSNKLQVATEFNYLILWQVEDPDPESHYFVVSVPSETYNEDSASDTCTLDTALTLEAKTEDVKKVWIREIRRKTDRRTRCQSRLTTGAWQK